MCRLFCLEIHHHMFKSPSRPSVCFTLYFLLLYFLVNHIWRRRCVSLELLLLTCFCIMYWTIIQEDAMFLTLTWLFNKQTIYTDAETAINTKAMCIQISLCVVFQISLQPMFFSLVSDRLLYSVIFIYFASLRNCTWFNSS